MAQDPPFFGDPKLTFSVTCFKKSKGNAEGSIAAAKERGGEGEGEGEGKREGEGGGWRERGGGPQQG